MSTRDSTQVANIEALVPEHNEPGNLMGLVKIAQGNFEVEFTIVDANAGRMVLTRLPAKAVILSLEIAHDALTASGSTDTDVGINTPDGVVKNGNFFHEALDMGSARAFTDLRFTKADKNTVGQPLWQNAGDPNAYSVRGGEYDIVLQNSSVVNPASGTLAYRIKYIIL